MERTRRINAAVSERSHEIYHRYKSEWGLNLDQAVEKLVLEFDRMKKQEEMVAAKKEEPTITSNTPTITTENNEVNQ